MIYIPYDEAVAAMERGLLPLMPEETAHRFARIFADNSADGVHSHGMNRYPRYIGDMKSGFCDASITKAERVSGMGGFEVWDAHFGVGPIIAEEAGQRAMALAAEHGIGCVALRNNSHWLRAGRYALQMADAGYVSLCFTNTCMNLAAWGAKTHSTGNNPIAMAVPHEGRSLLMDMAVSQYAYGKLEVMAHEGKMLDAPCGYDAEGNETCDPAKIVNGGVMYPMAMWKGSALSIMMDFVAVSLSGGRSSLEMGPPADGEKGMSQVFIAFHPDALPDKEVVAQKIRTSMEFFHQLQTAEGTGGVHTPGENLLNVRRRNMEEGLPVTEATWAKILECGK